MGLRRLNRGHELARRRSARARLDVPVPADALARGLDLWDLRPDLFCQPPDSVRKREEKQVRSSWARLRERLAPDSR